MVVVSLGMVGINRLVRAILNFCCCLACWLIVSCRSSLQFVRSSHWLISVSVTGFSLVVFVVGDGVLAAVGAAAACLVLVVVVLSLIWSDRL